MACGRQPPGGIALKNQFSLSSLTGEELALKSVHLAGRVHELLMTMKLQQHYLNESEKDVEIIYTFPLPWNATLMGMAVELTGKRMQATVTAKQQALADYERAVENGDTAVMVEKTAVGLYTANLGNIKSGERISIEIEYAQLLKYEQDQVRLCVPTVIAEKYGNAHEQGLLASHETTQSAPLAEYKLTAELHVSGVLARSNISCASHTVSMAAADGGIVVSLQKGAYLDRDFILNFGGLTGDSFAVSIPDGDATLVLASFCPKLPFEHQEPLLLKILVDCSGSMRGNGIQSARQALHSLLHGLNETDFLSFSRFGDEVTHDLQELQPCTPTIIDWVSRAVSATQANLGGTELNQALADTALSVNASGSGERPASILLITDAAVWDCASAIETCRKLGQRVFAIGVGASPAESLLRDLAEQTGGACEFVSPNEPMLQAVERMVHRMRRPKLSKVTVDWGQEPLWQTPVPAYFFDQESVHLYARLQHPSVAAPKLSCEMAGQRYEASPECVTQTGEHNLSRLAAASRMLAMSKADQLALALQYQLLSRQTNLILVHARAEGEKLQGLPAIRQVKQMTAAGKDAHADTVASPWRNQRAPSQAPEVSQNVPSVWRMSRSRVRHQASHPTPEAILQCFENAVMSGSDFAQAVRAVRDLVWGTVFEKVFLSISAPTLSETQAWAVFLEALTSHASEKFVLGRYSQRLLRASATGCDPKVVADVELMLYTVLSA
jgi:Ca-activated chloride channel family protein